MKLYNFTTNEVALPDNDALLLNAYEQNMLLFETNVMQRKRRN